MQNTSTGGLMWQSKFAEYAAAVYDKTTIIDVTEKSSFMKNNRVLSIIYYTLLLLRKSNWHAFVDHNLNIRLSLPLLISRFVKGAHYSLICHHVVYRLRTGPVRRLFEYVSEKLILKMASLIIVASHKTAHDVRQFEIDESRIRVINPTLTYRSSQLPNRRVQNRLLFIGNLEPRKGAEVAIRALSLIRDLNFSLDIVGGHLRQEQHFLFLKTIVEGLGLHDRVTFHGKVDGESLVYFYRRSDIFVFPSLHEGYGTVLLEAMSFGLPIVASDIAPINEVITDSVNGYLFPAGDAHAMADRLRALLVDSNLQRRIGRRNFEASRDFPTWQDVVRKTYDALEPYFDHEHSS